MREILVIFLFCLIGCTKEAELTKEPVTDESVFSNLPIYYDAIQGDSGVLKLQWFDDTTLYFECRNETRGSLYSGIAKLGFDSRKEGRAYSESKLHSPLIHLSMDSILSADLYIYKEKNDWIYVATSYDSSYASISLDYHYELDPEALFRRRVM